MANLSGSWLLLASEERLKRSSQAVSVLGSQAYIFGGELVPRQPVDSRVDLVRLQPGPDDTVTETLEPTTQAPSARVGSPAAALKHALYLFSGRGGLAMAPLEEDGSVWRYSPDPSRWDLIKPKDPSAPFPAGRSYHCLTSDGRETIYLHGGCPETGRLADLWAFNTASVQWTRLPDAPSPARGGASIAFQDGRLFRINGFDGKTEQGGALDSYDPSTGSWSTYTFRPDGVQGPEPRSVSTLLALTVQGRSFLVTMFGERDPSSLGHAGAGKMLADLWAFDVQSLAWSQVVTHGTSPVPRGWFDADVVDEKEGQTILIHGGLAEDNSRLGDVWKLQIKKE